MFVLVVEPDKRVAKNLRTALESAGHLVRCESSAEAAIHAADDKTPDAIVLELHLKVHNGIEFLYELRSYPEWQDVPVVVYSLTHPEQFVSDESVLHQLGITEVLYKPAVRLDQVVKAVQRTANPLLS